MSQNIEAPTYPRPSKSWQPPDMSMLKINIDAVSCKHTRRMGIGVVIQDSLGFVIGAMADIVQGCFELYIDECLAIRNSLVFGYESGLLAKKVESLAKCSA